MGEYKEYTIILSDEDSRIYEEQAEKLNCSVQLLMSQILSDYKNIKTSELEKEESYPQITVEKLTTNRIKSLGIPPHVKGYEYIKSAIIETVNDYKICDSTTNTLFPFLAKKFKTTPAAVSSGIRNAIAIMFDKGNKDLINSLFRYNVSINKPPATKEAIAVIAESIRSGLV